MWHALQAAGFKQPAKAMYILPACDVPHLEAVLTPTWQLPGGRHPDQHHIFPVDLPVRLGTKPCCEEPKLPNLNTVLMHVS